jgi:hypothetical protein
MDGIAKFFLPVALILWGMRSLQTRGQAPTANAAAYRSLVFGLGAWAVLLIQSAFAPMLPGWAIAGAIAAIVLAGVCAVTFGVIGLARLRRLRSGATQAVLGILVGGGFAGVVTWGVFVGFSSARTADAQAPAPIELADFQLVISLPQGWKTTDVSHLNKDIHYAWAREDPTIAFLVKTEHAPSGMVFSQAGLTTQMRANLEKAQGAKIKEAPMAVGGRDGVRFEFEATGAGQLMHTVLWCHAEGPNVLLFTFSTPLKEARGVEFTAEVDGILSSIKSRSAP